jgi:hypothetical protein
MQAIYEWLAIAYGNKSFWEFAAGMVLPVFSVFGVWLSTSVKPTTRRIGFACGIVSQPFWFYAAINMYNLGVFINSIFFTLLWVARFIQMFRYKEPVVGIVHKPKEEPIAIREEAEWIILTEFTTMQKKHDFSEWLIPKMDENTIFSKEAIESAIKRFNDSGCDGGIRSHPTGYYNELGTIKRGSLKLENNAIKGEVFFTSFGKEIKTSNAHAFSLFIDVSRTTAINLKKRMNDPGVTEVTYIDAILNWIVKVK